MRNVVTEEAEVRAAFDRVAPVMDEVIVRNPINAWMHRVNMAKLSESFPPGSCLLELGCGSGADAIAMARRGCQVFAFDLSEAMVAQARAKVAAGGLQNRVVVACGTSNDLDGVVAGSPWKEFDGAYANFTLTYVADLGGVARALAKILRPAAPFVCTIQGRVALSEVLLYGARLRFSRIVSRLSGPLIKDVHGVMVETFPASTDDVRRAFLPWFDLKELVGVPTFLPPVYLHPYYRRIGGGTRLLEFLDDRLAGRFPWNRLGEHTLYRFERRRG